MSTIATWEPTKLTAGDRWLWERQDLADYPAGTWVLSYSLAKADRQITLTSTAYGGAHRIDVSAATTAAYPAGRYSWAAYVTSGSDRRQVGSGALEILPNLATATSGFDNRSQARRSLENIRAVLEGRATRDQEAYSIAGRSLNRTSIPDLITLENHFATQVAREDDAQSIANGLGNPRHLFVRYRGA